MGGVPPKGMLLWKKKKSDRFALVLSLEDRHGVKMRTTESTTESEGKVTMLLISFAFFWWGRGWHGRRRDETRKRNDRKETCESSRASP